MDRAFVNWKRIFDIRRRKVPVSETNYQRDYMTTSNLQTKQEGQLRPAYSATYLPSLSWTLGEVTGRPQTFGGRSLSNAK
ncbi:hypothetical protein H5410_014089 [Solanum commersonii]|uniref:Uncharacterized protein n=1 Tax=Solanum commersonii TaxID=4109 RepID=A0A9J5ZPZ7_SOLCO|nr:hypothetical protein H5410_014089 [Solanum commersonii]